MTPIEYTEKGAALHVRLAELGLPIEERDGVWVALGDPVTTQAAIDDYTLVDVQADLVARIDAHAASLRDAVVAGISPAEMASWTVKRREALDYQATADPAKAPMLAIESAARGAALAEVVARVLASASRLSHIEAAIAGIAGKHKDTVRAAGDFEAALTYDWSTGWPSI